MSPAGCAAVFPSAARPAYGRAGAGAPRGGWRVITIRACDAVAAGCLLVLLLYPPPRHYPAARWAGIAVSAAVSIACGLAYWRNRRRRS